MSPLAAMIDSCLPRGTNAMSGKRREDLIRAIENRIGKEIADLFFHAVDGARKYDNSANFVFGYVRGGLCRVLGADLPDLPGPAELGGKAVR